MGKFFKLLFIVFLSLDSFASEPDELVIANADLKDSTKVVSKIVESIFLQVSLDASKIFKDITENDLKLKAGIRTVHKPKRKSKVIYKKFKSPLEAAEYAFAKAYYDLSFSDKSNVGHSVFESAVGQSLKDGGYLKVGENKIIDKVSKYPGLVKGKTANFCGQNIGLDKLSHFFGDGFLMHEQFRRGKLRSLDDVIKLSDLFERTTMGLEFTGVYSKADIVANVQGVKFFNKLTSGESLIVGSKSVSFNLEKFKLCDYFTDDFSENKHPNVYRFLGKRALEANKRKKAKRDADIEAGTCSSCEKQKISSIETLKLISTQIKHGTLGRLSGKYPQRIYGAYMGYVKKPALMTRKSKALIK